jgi:hypothetical protein
MDNNCEYVNQHYNVNACIGRRIDFKGRGGIIAEDRGNYIGVTFDDQKPGTVDNLHPTWKVKYLEMGTVRKMTRSQKRYADYLRSEVSETFSEWMGFA